MKKTTPILLIAIILITISPAKSQESRFKSLFLYQFTKHVEWPPQLRNGNFIIATIGNTPISRELKLLSRRKSVGNQAIEIKKYGTIDEVEYCHVLFIPKSKSSLIKPIRKKLNSTPTLIITDKPGMIKQGSCINYITKQGRIKFEISPSNFTNRNLKVSKSLVQLGVPAY